MLITLKTKAPSPEQQELGYLQFRYCIRIDWEGLFWGWQHQSAGGPD